MTDNNLIAFIYTEYKGEVLYYRKDHISPFVLFDYNDITQFSSIAAAEQTIDVLRPQYPEQEFGIKYVNINEDDLKVLVGGKVTLQVTEKIVGQSVGVVGVKIDHVKQ